MFSNKIYFIYFLQEKNSVLHLTLDRASPFVIYLCLARRELSVRVLSSQEAVMVSFLA